MREKNNFFSAPIALQRCAAEVLNSLCSPIFYLIHQTKEWPKLAHVCTIRVVFLSHSVLKSTKKCKKTREITFDEKKLQKRTIMQNPSDIYLKLVQVHFFSSILKALCKSQLIIALRIMRKHNKWEYAYKIRVKPQMLERRYQWWVRVLQF